VFYLLCHETMNSISIRPFGVCHPYYLVCSNYVGVMNISWKISLLFGHNTVHGMSHKSLRKYHNLHRPGLDSAAKFYCWALFVKTLGTCNYSVSRSFTFRSCCDVF